MLQKYSKGLVSLLVFAFAAVALFFGNQIFGYNITADFQSQVIALIPLGAGVIAVIGTKNATEDAIDKAIMQLVTGLIAVSQFFAQIPSDLGVKVAALVYAGVAAYFVWRKANTPSLAAVPAAAGGVRKV
jgi:ABC-type transporter Mla subunit MlaD